MVNRRSKIEDESLEGFLLKKKENFEEILCRFVEIPSVSMDPRHERDIKRTVHLAVETLTAMGAEAHSVKTYGSPVVIGRFHAGPDCPTVTIYNHLDVQPADEPEWEQDPFKFQIIGERYLGRGATDDKGPAITALLAARFAMEKEIPLNIQFIWELEEEIGSPNFEGFLKEHHGAIKTDSILISDTIWLAKGRPAVPYGLRGLLTARLILETGYKNAHSGLTGGAARNPVSELCELVAACQNLKTGRIKIPGFYEDIVPLQPGELRRFSSSPFSLSRFRKAHGLVRLRTKDRLEVMRRIWTQPTFEVHGIVGGYQGPGVKTAIPPQAEAKISMRLVPNQNPKKIITLLKRYIHQLNPGTRVIPEGFLAPYLGEPTGPYAEAVRSALAFGFGREPVFLREGGSIGPVVTMKQYLKAPIVFMGLSLPEHGYHAPNEYFDWGQASGGIKAFVKYFQLIAGLNGSKR